MLSLSTESFELDTPNGSNPSRLHLSSTWLFAVIPVYLIGRIIRVIFCPVFLSWDSDAKAQPGKKYISLFIIALHTLSRGTVHIASSDPNAPPTLNHEYLTNEVDAEVLTEAVNFGRKIAASEPLKNIVVAEAYPGPEIVSKEQIREWMRSHTSTVYHASGSCSMLPLEKGGVVDDTLRVYGVDNLRVVSSKKSQL